MKKALIKTALSTLLAVSSLAVSLPFTTAAVQAQAEMRAEQLLQNMLSNSGKTAFTGQRELKVFRSNSAPLTATSEVIFKNANNYQLKITGPDAIRGITFRSDAGKITAFFPDEKLYLFNGVPQTAYMPERIILSSLNNDFNKIMANYEVKRVADEIENLTQAYVLDFVPKHRVSNGGKDYWFTPRRKYWVDKSNFQVLKEERYWDMGNNPYSVVKFTSFNASPGTVVPEFKTQDNVTRIDLGAKNKNSFNTYGTLAAAESAEKDFETSAGRAYKIWVDMSNNSSLNSKAVFSESFSGREFCEKMLFGTFQNKRNTYDSTLGKENFQEDGTDKDGIFVCIVFK